MKQFFDGLVVCSASIGTSNGVHSSVPYDWVFWTAHFLNKGLGLLLFAVHLESETHWKGSNDLLMLLVLNVIQEVLNGFLIGSSNHDETHSVASCFTDNCWVGITVEKLLKFFIDLSVVGCNCDKSQTEADSMLNGFILAAVSDSIFQVVDCFIGILVLVYQAICKVSSCCRIWWVLLTGNACPREVGIQDGKCILAVSSVDQTQRCSSIESIPILCLSNPRQVIVQEWVVGRVSILERIRPHSRTMQNWRLWTDLLLYPIDYLNIRVVVFL